MAHEHDGGAEMRRGTISGSGQMPAGMAAELKSGAIAGAVADGMPVAAMNGAGPRPNPMHVGSGRLQEMPPAGTSAFQEMPAGGMTPAHASGAAMPGGQASPGAGAVFAEMPAAGGSAPAPAAAGEPAAEPGVITLRGEWRLNLTLRG